MFSMVDLTYKHKNCSEQHKLRTIVRKQTGDIVGIGMPKGEVAHLVGCYFRMSVQGDTIILTSGAKI